MIDEKLMVVNESASVILHERSSNAWELKNFRSDKPGQGHGRGLMEMVCKIADSQGYVLLLTAQPYGRVRPGDLNSGQLVDFYKKFGFNRVDQRRPPRMRREPSQNLPAS